LIVGRTPVGLITKGPMIVRDIDVLQDLSHVTRGSTVYVSVPTTDEDAWRTLEPGTAHPMQRLRAVRALVDAGIDAGVLMSPLVPGFSTQPAKIEATVKAIADHGAHFVGANLLFLDGGTRDHFMRFLAGDYPMLLDQYDRLYASKYAPKDYAERVRQTVAMLKRQYGVNDRKRRGEVEDAHQAPDPAKGEAQAAFEF
jgi:DNA repair photolyase